MSKKSELTVETEENIDIGSQCHETIIRSLGNIPGMQDARTQEHIKSEILDNSIPHTTTEVTNSYEHQYDIADVPCPSGRDGTG